MLELSLENNNLDRVRGSARDFILERLGGATALGGSPLPPGADTLEGEDCF